MKHIRRILAITTITAICVSLSVSVPIMAAPPSVGNASINPDPAYTDTPLIAIPSDDWFDADGDPKAISGNGRFGMKVQPAGWI